MRETNPWPHEGGCPTCRKERVCNYCGRAGVICTNGRCMKCHVAVCTGHGIESEHGYGKVGGPHYKGE